MVVNPGLIAALVKMQTLFLFSEDSSPFQYHF